MAASQDKIVADIIRARDRINCNNESRTNFYANYWKRNQEIPWALLASHVSRNAGYQMTDIARYKIVYNGSLNGVIIVGGWFSQLIATIAQYGGTDTLDALFTLLECGNYLIFKDVYPPLRIYELAKNNPSNPNFYLELLNRDEFKIDQFIRDEWYSFYQKGVQSQFSEAWKNDWSNESHIQRHSFALIVNEQNQIEDRLINYTQNYYLKNHRFGSSVINSLINLSGELGFTRLCFPLSNIPLGKSRYNTVDSLLIYQVAGFTNLSDRIQAGKDMYAAIFNSGPATVAMRKLINASFVIHQGTRAAYNNNYYDAKEASSLIPGGKKYSPAYKLVWPGKPTNLWKFSHITRYRPLPKSIADRNSTDLAGWLAPLASPLTRINAFPVDNSLPEIIY